MKRGGSVLAGSIILLISFGGPSFVPSCGSLCGVEQAFAAEKTLAQLEAEYDREQNPKRRVKLAVEITEARLKPMLSAYQAGEPAKEAQEMTNYLSAISRLEQALSANSIHGVSKDAEIRLRGQTRALANLRMSVSAAEQPAVQKALDRVTQLHERLLNGIMNPSGSP